MAGESKLQKKIIKDLEKIGWYVVKLVITNKAGIPDVVALNKGRVIFMEFKDEGKEAEPLQIHRHNELKVRGFAVYIIDKWEDYLYLKLLNFRK